MRDEGVSKDLMVQMLQALPSDAKIAGFGEDNGYATCFVLVTSKQFKDVQEGYRPNDILARFKTNWSEKNGYEPVFERLDLSEALENSNCCRPSDMKLYTGLNDVYKYCTKCGKKEKA